MIVLQTLNEGGCGIGCVIDGDYDEPIFNSDEKYYRSK